MTASQKCSKVLERWGRKSGGGEAETSEGMDIRGDAGGALTFLDYVTCFPLSRKADGKLMVESLIAAVAGVSGYPGRNERGTAADFWGNCEKGQREGLFTGAMASRRREG